METIKKVLMRRDQLTAQQADDLIADAVDEFKERMEDEPENFSLADEIVYDYFSLEPDYSMELLGMVE